MPEPTTRRGTSNAAVATMPRAERAEREPELVVPRIEERVVVGRREVEGDRVRIAKTVEADEVDVVGEALKEDVEVERVAVNRILAEPPCARVEGDVTIIPVVEEIVVVEKRFLLKEEVRVTKRRRVVRRKLRVPVRRERVTVERMPSGTKPTETEKRRSR